MNAPSDSSSGKTKISEPTRDAFNRGKVDFTKKCPVKGCLLCNGHPDAHKFKRSRSFAAQERADNLTEQLYDLLQKFEGLPRAVAVKIVKNLEDIFLASAIKGEDVKERYWTLNELVAVEGVREFLCTCHSVKGRSKIEIELSAR